MSFRFRPVLSICALLGLSVLLGLGNWQLQRLNWKRDLIEKTQERVAAEPQAFEAVETLWREGRDTEYMPVEVVGAYRHDLEAHVFGTYDAKPGYYVFTPLQSASGEYLYVNRGFVPQSKKFVEERLAGQIEGVQTVRGLFRSAEENTGLAGAMRPIDDLEKNVWYRRAPEAFARTAGIEAPPVYIDSFGTENLSDLPQGGVTRIEFNNRHLEYALTWFGLAATLVGVYTAFSLRRK